MTIDFFYIECPHCKTWFAHNQIMSYTIYGNVECWSDGKTIIQNMWEYSNIPFVKCQNCNNFLWIEDARSIYEYEINQTNEKKHQNQKLISDFINKNSKQYIEKIKNIDYPPTEYSFDMSENMIKDLTEILKTTNKNQTTREIYIRTKIWQHANNYVRLNYNLVILILKNKVPIRNIYNLILEIINNKKKYKKINNLRIANLIILKEKINSSNDKNDYKIISIEIERELGNFAKARKLIQDLNYKEKQDNITFIKKTKWHILFKSKKVFVI